MESFTFLKLFYFQFHALAVVTLLFTSPSMAIRLQMQSKSDVNFVRSWCNVTMYPDICYQTLSSYASTIHTSPKELANAALSISLNGARSTSNLVLKLSKEHGLSPGEAAAVADCVETMGDSVDELRQSMAEMKGLKGPDLEIKLSNIQTWVSAALTNEDTCMDGIEGKADNGKIKDTIKDNVGRVAQLTSNALAFVNKLYS